MRRKSLIQLTFSLILALCLVITTVIISPRVASAEENYVKIDRPIVELLITAMELEKEGDVVKAQVSYRQIFSRGRRQLKVLITALGKFAEIKRSQGEIEKANELEEAIENGIIMLNSIPPTPEPIPCEDCGGNLMWSGRKCTSCSEG